MIKVKGFTLIELVIALTIVVIISITAIPYIIDSVRGARENTLKYNLSTIRKAIDKFRGDTGVYPRSIRVLEIKGYLAKIPVDPSTGKTDWEVAINVWPYGASSYVDGWVIDPSKKDFAGIDFIAPVATGEPFFDDPANGDFRYRSARGIRNIRSRKRFRVSSSIPNTDPLVDPFHNPSVDSRVNKLGRPLYQFFKINREREDGASVPENYYPFFIIEKYQGNFHTSIPSNDNVNFPDSSLVFDEGAGNYAFSSGSSEIDYYNGAYDTEEISADDYLY